LIFAIALKTVSITGMLPIPYLLKKAAGKKYFEIYKQLNTNDIGSDMITDERIEDIIKLCNLLRFDELNKKYNKKYHKTDFGSFFESIDESIDERLKKNILRAIDLRKSELLDLIDKENDILFIKDDKHSENIYFDQLINFSDIPLNIKFDFEKKGRFYVLQTNGFERRGKVGYNIPPNICPYK